MGLQIRIAGLDGALLQRGAQLVVQPRRQARAPPSRPASRPTRRRRARRGCGSRRPGPPARGADGSPPSRAGCVPDRRDRRRTPAGLPSAATSFAEIARPPVDRLQDDGDAVRSTSPAASASSAATACGCPGVRSQHVGVAIDGRDHVIQLGSYWIRARRNRAASRFARIADAIEGGGQQIGQLVPLAPPRPAAAPAPRRSPDRWDRRSIASRSVPIARLRLVELLLVELRAPAQEREASPPDRRRARPPRRTSSRSSDQAPQRSSAVSNSCATCAIVGARVVQPPVVASPPPGARAQPVVEDLRGAAHDVQHRRVLAQLALEVAASRLAATSSQRLSLSARRSELLGLRRSVGASWNTLPYQRSALSKSSSCSSKRRAIRFVQASRAAGSSVCTRRISPILISDGQSARAAYTGSSSSAACPCTAMSSSILSSIVMAPGWSGSPDSTTRRCSSAVSRSFCAIVLDLRHPVLEPTRSRSASAPRLSRSSRSRVRSAQRSALIYSRSSAWAASRSLPLISSTRSYAAIASSRRSSGLSARRPICSRSSRSARGSLRQLRAPHQHLVERLGRRRTCGRCSSSASSASDLSGTRSSTRRW